MPDRVFAIGVDDGATFWIVLTIRRSAQGDVYVNFPRDATPGWKPHASYHSSGQHHQKSFNQKGALQHLSKPDANFKGSVNVVTTGLATGEAQAIGLKKDPVEFDDSLRILEAEISPERYRTYVSVDLVEPAELYRLATKEKVLRQAVFKDAIPWIVVTLRA
jgi:hypothetical protein